MSHAPTNTKQDSHALKHYITYTTKVPNIVTVLLLTVIYPTDHSVHRTRPRAITLINKRLNTNNWRQIPFPSADVIIVQISGTFGHMTIFNIYDDSRTRVVMPILTEFLSNNRFSICASPTDHMIWLRDFNSHHFLWEEEQNVHLCNMPQARQTAQVILDLMAQYSMQLALPKNHLTL